MCCRRVDGHYAAPHIVCGPQTYEQRFAAVCQARDDLTDALNAGERGAATWAPECYWPVQQADQITTTVRLGGLSKASRTRQFFASPPPTHTHARTVERNAAAVIQQQLQAALDAQEQTQAQLDRAIQDKV